jgi:flavin reductase (DIM6/NTAB) family NADH-FMN oxidoreductase RutF
VPVDRDVFRAISSSFPTGVVIVAVRDANGEPRGLTSQAYLGLSTDPPLMLVALDKTSRTLPVLRRTGAFVINFLREGTEDLATLFASKSDEKFQGVRWTPCVEARGSPILRDFSVAYAGCVVSQTIDGGDHSIVIGTVEAGEVLGGIPLIYYRRTYAPWPEVRPAPRIGGT